MSVMAPRSFGSAESITMPVGQYSLSLKITLAGIGEVEGVDN